MIMNVDNDDDDDEFAHLSLDVETEELNPSSSSGTNDHNNTTSTTTTDNDMNDTMFDLQMTMVTMQTEHDVTIQRIQQQNKLQVRYLQDEVRKLQNETNRLLLVSSSSVRNSSSNNYNNKGNNGTRIHNPPQRPPPPQQQQPGSNLFARSNAILLPYNNSNNNHSQHHQRPSPPPPQQQTLGPAAAVAAVTTSTYHRSDNDNIHQHQQQPSTVSFQHYSSGQRLIHQLIRQMKQSKEQQPQHPTMSSRKQNNNNRTNGDIDFDSTSSNKDIAIRLMQLLSGSTTTVTGGGLTSVQLTEWDVLHWFVVEILQIPPIHAVAVADAADIATYDNDWRTGDEQLQSLLRWFRDALLLCSPISYQHVVRHLQQQQQQQPLDGLSLSSSSISTTRKTNQEESVSSPDARLVPPSVVSSVSRKRNRRVTSISCSGYQGKNNCDHDNTPGTTITNEQQQQNDITLYQQIEQHLSHPLLALAAAGGTTGRQHDLVMLVQPTTTTEQQHANHTSCPFGVHRFVKDCILRWCDIGQFLSVVMVDDGCEAALTISNTVDVDDATATRKKDLIKRLHQISILSIQILSFLSLSHSHTIHGNDENTLVVPSSTNGRTETATHQSSALDHCCGGLFINMIRFGIHVLVHAQRQNGRNNEFDEEVELVETLSSNGRNNVKKNHSTVRSRKFPNSSGSNIASSNHHNRKKHTPPLRLIHIDYMNDYAEQTASDPDDSSIRNKNKDIVQVDNRVFAPFTIDDSLTWMAEALNVLTSIIWTKRTMAARTALSRQEINWIQTKRTGALMGIILDVLEHTILPNMSLYHHAFTITCIRWMQQLIDRPLSLATKQHETPASTLNESNLVVDNDDDETRSSYNKSNYYYWRLLRTQNVTNYSTAELWQTSPTAINIIIQIFTRIVLHQMTYDHRHSPDESGTGSISCTSTAYLSMLHLRDEIIRFMYRIVLHIQNDRQIWEQQHSAMKQMKLALAAKAIATITKGNTNATTTTTTTKKHRMRPILSFIIVLSDQVEMYKSMITTLLSSSSPHNNDTDTGTYYDHYFRLNDDLNAMLKFQLDEIIDDQYDKLQHG